MTDRLVEIPHHGWSKLRDLYKVDWPKNHVGYYTVDNFVRWIQKDPNIKNLHVYSLNGDWSDGTFLIVDRYQLFLNSLNKTNDRLKIALSLLDWTHGFKISSFLHRHRPAVIAIVNSRKYEKESDNLTPLYYLPKEKARLFDITPPDGTTLKPMLEEHAVIVDDAWPNQHVGSLFLLKRLINWNPQIGAFTKDGELVAWCLRLQAGSLGALQVKTAYMRQGLGTLVTKAMSKLLADMDHDTFALIDEKNTASQKILLNTGYVNYDEAYWLRTKSQVDFTWEDTRT